MLLSLVFFYLVMSACFFTKWVEIFKRDTSISPQEKYLHWMILAFITILWPFVVPIAYLELLSKLEKRSVIKKAR